MVFGRENRSFLPDKQERVFQVRGTVGARSAVRTQVTWPQVIAGLLGQVEHLSSKLGFGSGPYWTSPQQCPLCLITLSPYLALSWAEAKQSLLGDLWGSGPPPRGPGFVSRSPIESR